MTKSREVYPTDLDDTEYPRIAPYLPETKSTGAPRTVPWREILNGIFYEVKAGCTWRSLPHDLPKWKTVYHYFRLFRLSGLWETINEKVREDVRQAEGREAQASAMIIDSQSAKTAEGGEERGYDGGKKVSGRKRNLVVDMLGMLVLAKVTAAKICKTSTQASKPSRRCWQDSPADPLADHLRRWRLPGRSGGMGERKLACRLIHCPEEKGSNRLSSLAEALGD